MKPSPNRVGQRFHRLVLLCKSSRKDYWTCQCDCGTIKDIVLANLLKLHGGTQSCGCLRKEKNAAWLANYQGTILIDPTQEKICRTCLTVKLLDAFWVHSEAKDGRRNQCSDCMNTRRHEPDKLAKTHEHYLVLKTEGKTWRQLHPEESRQKIREWHAAHSDERRTYRQNNKEKRAKQLAAWEAAHPGDSRMRCQRRRAALANALVNDFSHAQWLEIQAAQDHRCYYCSKRRKGKLTQDHVIPLSKGGSHTASNIVAACFTCNSGKKDRKPPVAVQLLLLTEAPPRKRRTKKGKAA